VIPPEITTLTKLQFLGLYRNSLCVHLPAGFGNLMKLQYFYASKNNLTGNLSEVRSLTQLVSLYLSFNNISGEVPLEFGEFEELVTLGLAGNDLTGELPQSLES
jgi:Leucine-rich repeat (LRR) protein